MAKYQLVIFDCDGTLYNTYPGVRANFEHTLEVLGRPPMPDDFNWKQCIGPLLEYSFEHFMGFTPEEVPVAVAAFRADYFEYGVKGSVLYDGMRNALEKLHGAGVRLAVASSKMQVNLDATLEKDQLHPLFAAVRGPSAENPISKTETIQLVLDQMNVPKEQVIMIGDTGFDAKGAQNLGIDFLAALWGFGSEKEFDDYPCVFYAEDPYEMETFLLQ